MQVFQTLAELYELPDWALYGIAAKTNAVFGPGARAFEGALKAALPGPCGVVDGYVKAHSHPEYTAKMPLMNPFDVLFAALLYLVVIAALNPIGKVIGKLQLKTFGTIHNFFLFSLSFYMMSGVFITAVASGYSLWNNAVQPISSPNGWRMAKMIWIFYASKLPEFIDTVIMMLKQNYRQVSFLHMYHHCTIFVIWFIVTLEGPGGEAYFSAMLNSGVHVVMYGYYLGTSLFPTGRVRKVLDKFKFFITYGQMTQFAVNCCQSLFDLFVAPKPNYPTHLIELLFYYMLTLLALFGNFLVQNKGKAKAKKA